eukprot:COSAG06_NODE_8772_length_2075_cov_1.722166_2_plen_195_part_00
MGGIPKHCVHGDVGASDQNSLCDPLAAQLEEYTQAGEIMSTTVRVKDGENKSWCLITFSHAQDAEACVAGGCKVQALDGRRWLSLKVKLQDVKGEIVKASTGALAQMATVQQKKVQQTAKKMQKVSAASGSTRFDVQHAHALLFGGKSEEESQPPGLEVQQPCVVRRVRRSRGWHPDAQEEAPCSGAQAPEESW